jgi:ABC-type multidrug transport system fused ATPase/permease subunit
MILEFLRQHKVLLIGYIIVLIIVPLQDIGIPHIIGKVLESLRTNNVNYKYIYMLIGLICLVQVGHTINDIIEIKIFPLFQKFVCNKILNYIFDMSSVNLQDILNGKILSIMAHAPRTMYNYIDVWRVDILPQIVVFLVAIIYIGRLNYKLGLIIVFVIIVYYFMAFFTMDKCNEPARNREQFLIEVNEQVDDVLMNVVGIMNAGEKKNELSKLDGLYDNYKKLGEETMFCTLKYKFVLVPIMLMSIIVFILIGTLSVQSKQMSIESFIVCVIIYLYIFNSIIKIINDVRDTAIRGGMIKEHLKLFNSMKENEENNSPLTGNFKDKYIYFDNIVFKYGETTILNNFSLEIKKGEKLLIIGQIGSGKTTILKLLLRYNTATSGHIYYKGIPLDTISREDIRKNIGYIPQTPILLNRTLYQNITYGRPNVTKDHVMKLIKDLELDHIFNETRLDQLVGKHGSKLSGGQRQVVWILRVLVQNPEILVMDEPTSAIDKDTKTFIDRLFELVMKNRTVIIVSHDEYMSKLCDRTVKMNT